VTNVVVGLLAGGKDDNYDYSSVDTITSDLYIYDVAVVKRAQKIVRIIQREGEL